ncbi:MAG: MiaB/RimO family radical SAM methylthiotransferase [Candidatus Eisenbacteria bacterium]|nr:MiaB/RimO family radical SAM methylthiotransferase [Candidatus Latescibacterota bacterium]MBD3303416.1 MiaB/RimO family radical SAM methylthiotransferase [Candidatus Eisenbacteria bacterium]
MRQIEIPAEKPAPIGGAAPTVAVFSHGCRANQEEIECLLGALRDRGFRPVPFGGSADWTIINTCSVTHAGEADARRTIRRAVRLSGGGRVVVTGCFAQRDPADAARLGADLVVGNGEKWRIPDLLTSAASGEGSCTGVLFQADPTTRRFLGHGTRPSGFRTRAALKVQDGCDERCTYCIIPSLRGRSVSRDPDEVLAEARLLVESGHQEITLTGIHTAAYGADRGGPNLAGLLRRLLAVERLERIRLNSLEPQWVDAELLDTLASSPRFCRHLHLPLQSGDAGVLKRMGRGYRPEAYREVAARARAAIPGVGIGADVMVGFPGEDEEAYANTVALLEEVRPSYLHVFPYSERPGVASARLPGRVDEETKRRRARRLAALDRRFRTAFLRAADGAVHDLIVEAKEDRAGGAQCLTDTYIRVAVETDRSAGSWVTARLRWIGDPRRMRGIAVDSAVEESRR